MRQEELLDFFDERFSEIEAYLAFLHDIESATRSGAPKIEHAEASISAPQQRILYSSVYLQLYNLIEATVSRSISAVSQAAASSGRWQAKDLSTALQREWVRVMAHTHTDMSPDKRLDSAINMCHHIIEQLPIQAFEVEVGGGGNWDDDAIEKISARVGCRLEITHSTRTGVKRHVRDDLGALKLVKNRRNRLAHGSISFVECADGVTVGELLRITDAIGAYLREVITAFNTYIELFEYLQQGSRPKIKQRRTA